MIFHITRHHTNARAYSIQVYGTNFWTLYLKTLLIQNLLQYLKTMYRVYAQSLLKFSLYFSYFCNFVSVFVSVLFSVFSLFTYYTLLLHITTHYYTLLHITTHYYTLLYITITHYYTLLHIITHNYTLLLHTTH